MEEKTVTISVERFSELVGQEARCNVLESYTLNTRYSIERDMIAAFLGFTIPANKADNE